MINLFKKTSAYVITSFLFSALVTTSAFAQFNDIGAFLRAGADDATILTKEYLRPFPTGFGTGLNAGWNEEAAPKKTLGFSIQIRPSLAIVPSSDQSFDISSLQLDKIVVAQGEDPVTPTIAGDNNSGPLLEIYDDPDSQNRTKLGEFTMPQGTGFSFVPAPVVQASLGLVKGTEATLRFFPETEIGDMGQFGVLGGSLKHDITQWLTAGNLLPVDISIQAGFNQISVNGALNLQPEGVRNPNDPSLTSNPNPNFDKQLVETTTNTFVMNALVGKSIPFISVYGGVGYQTASLNLDISGDYPVNTSIAGQSFYNVVTDPVSFSLDSESAMHLLGGFRLKLGILAIYGEATLANYFTANAGVGISFR